jgi:membrane protease YdiL (CAAX protease family)
MKGIPAWAALPIAAAFLIEFPFYLLPAFGAARLRSPGLRSPGLLAIACVAPYLVYSVPTGEFRAQGFLVLLAIVLAACFWYKILPKSPVGDVLFVVFLAGVYVSKVFAGIYLSPLPALGRDLPVLGHLMLIRTALIAILAIRGGVNVESRFIPNAREWLIGLRWFVLLVPACGAALWAQGLARVRPQPHNVLVVAAIAVGEFAGILWVVALSEEFLFRGLLQQWFEQWTGSSVAALILASIVFGSAHLGFHGLFPNWRFAIVAAVFGLCCGLAWRESRTIQAPMVTHALGATLYRVFFQ